MPNKSRCRAKDPAICKTHGTPVPSTAADNTLATLGAKRAGATTARVATRQGRQQMLADLLADVNAGHVTEIDGRMYVGRPLSLAIANVDRLTYELERAARYGVETYGAGDPIEAAEAAWRDLVDTYDVSFSAEAPVIRDNEQTLRNALLERVHASAS